MVENLLFEIAAAVYLLAALSYAAWPLFSKNALAVLGRVLLACAALTLIACAGVRWVEAGRPPFSNLYESLIVFAIAMPVVYLAVERRYALKSAGFFVSLGTFGLMIAGSRLSSEIHPLMPALKSNWLVTHVLTCFVAYAALAISFICSALYLACRKKGPAEFLERMDHATYRTVAFGFLFLSIGIISGAVWAEKAWGRYWGWDPKETWALITWLIYGFYLHTRLVKGWKGAAGSWLAVIGFLAVVFTYLGVTFLLPGLHSYAS